MKAAVPASRCPHGIEVVKEILSSGEPVQAIPARTQPRSHLMAPGVSPLSFPTVAEAKVAKIGRADMASSSYSSSAFAASTRPLMSPLGRGCGREGRGGGGDPSDGVGR